MASLKCAYDEVEGSDLSLGVLRGGGGEEGGGGGGDRGEDEGRGEGIDRQSKSQCSHPAP